ncbi:MAG: FAD-dependent oxidoreductase, partial [Saprospiraceae bacterium]|nr:FAD-dependent oxidoreductase [Saprospiraceae bacterium]
DRKHMAAHQFEAEEALEEGVKINWLRTIKAMDEDTFTVEVMRLEDGRPVPTGQFETLEADTLILAVGQDTDTGFLRNVPGIEFNEDGTVIVGRDMMTGCEGIFAGGDMVPSERSVTVAIGHGKNAARYIDGFLWAKPYIKPPKHPVVGHERLHLWYKTHAPQREQAELPAEKRIEGFDEIKAGLSEEEAL